MKKTLLTAGLAVSTLGSVWAQRAESTMGIIQKVFLYPSATITQIDDSNSFVVKDDNVAIDTIRILSNDSTTITLSSQWELGMVKYDKYTRIAKYDKTSLHNKDDIDWADNDDIDWADINWTDKAIKPKAIKPIIILETTWIRTLTAPWWSPDSIMIENLWKDPFIITNNTGKSYILKPGDQQELTKDNLDQYWTTTWQRPYVGYFIKL